MFPSQDANSAISILAECPERTSADCSIILGQKMDAQLIM